MGGLWASRGWFLGFLGFVGGLLWGVCLFVCVLGGWCVGGGGVFGFWGLGWVVFCGVWLGGCWLFVFVCWCGLVFFFVFLVFFGLYGWFFFCGFVWGGGGG